MEKLQVHRYMVIMSEYSTSHGQNLVVIHELQKWQHHFHFILGMKEGGETFSWKNLVWLSDTDAWDDTQRGDITSW